MKKMQLLLNLGLLGFTGLNAQTEIKYNTKKWEHSFSTGVFVGNSKGIIPSRSEMNAHSKSVDSPDPLFGLAIDGKIQRNIKKSAIGISLNYISNLRDRRQPTSKYEYYNWNDHEPYYIKEEQSYTNLGIFFVRELYKTKSQKWRFNASFGAGLSINHTPDRTEYDTKQNRFITTGTQTLEHYTDGHLDSTYIGPKNLVSSSFNSGGFLTLSFSTKYNLSANRGVLFEINYNLQFLSMDQNYSSNKNVNTNSGPPSTWVITAHNYPQHKQYTVQSLQFKIGYFF